MARIVADSSTLILLAKCNLLEIVCDLFEVVVPKIVTVEVASKDLIRSYPDAALISNLVAKGFIRVQSPRKARYSLPISLHPGEKAALSLALSEEGSLLATDDGKAIKAARFLKLPFIITPKIVIELFKLEQITFKKARDSLEKLGKIGRYSPEIIADALVALMEEKDAKADNNKDT
jgi:predicted nucleic acid-binding protein